MWTIIKLQKEERAMKTLTFTIDLQSVEEGHSVELALHGLAAEHKYWRDIEKLIKNCLLYTSPSPRDRTRSRMPSSA